MEGYCNNCPKFEPLVKQAVVDCGYNVQTFGREMLVNTEIYCVHDEHCKQLAGYIEEEMRRRKRK